MRLPLEPPSKGGRNLSARAHAKRTRTRTLQNTSFCKVELAKYTLFAFFLQNICTIQKKSSIFASNLNPTTRETQLHNRD